MSFKSGVTGRGSDRWWERRWIDWWLNKQSGLKRLTFVVFLAMSWCVA